MSPLNPYFLQGSASEQRLVQNLINEQLRMYGQDVVYLPRKIFNKKTILKEITVSKFDDAFRLEAYLINYEGFGGQGDILSKFGVKTTDEVSFAISKERYEDFITPFLSSDPNIELSTRPEEGDLIYLPLDNTIFEIKYVEGKKPFYQLNNLYIYELRCEVMDYEMDEDINTSLEEVDKSVQDFGYIQTIQMTSASARTATASVSLASDLSAIGGSSIGRIDLVNDGTGYLTVPVVSISRAPTGGSTATAVAIMTHRSGQMGSSIDRILIISPGMGYTTAPTVTIKSNSGSGGIATAVLQSGSIGPFAITDSGFGYSSSPAVSISTAPSGGVSATAEVYINSSGIVTSIRYINAGVGYTQIPTITLSSPSGISTGSYAFNEIVRGVSTGTTAHVNDWNYDTRVLKLKIVNGSFTPGESIVGMGTTNGGSNASYVVYSIDKQDETDAYAENISIEDEADEIIDFSQDNPFGDY